MIRIIDEARPTVRISLEEALQLHRQGVKLTAFEGKQGAGMNVKAHDLGNGHIEVSASAPTVWDELDWTPIALELYLECAIERAESEAEERKEKSLTIAANRAKSKVRKLCKAMGADAMLTLTYWANETDLQRSKRDLKEFVRRMRRLIPGFRAVAVYETQKRGALHWHIATAGVPTFFLKTNASGQSYKVKSVDAIRAVWRSVTKERKGNIDLARRKASSQRSPAKIAAYIAKYIIKAFREGQAFTNRYSVFGDFDLPQPVSLGWYADGLSALEACYNCLLDAHTVILEKFSHFKDWYVLHAELPKAMRV